MSGSGNSVCCYAMNMSKRLYLKTKETEEIMSRYLILLEGWGFTGMTKLFFNSQCVLFLFAC